MQLQLEVYIMLINRDVSLTHVPSQYSFQAYPSKHTFQTYLSIYRKYDDDPQLPQAHVYVITLGLCTFDR
jgi:hypothetical protein